MNAGLDRGRVIRIALLIAAVSALAACEKDKPDWRQAVIADAEGQVRARLGDPGAEFSAVQVTGDSSSGQTCGIVHANPPAAAHGGSGRFIVYIDKAAGPFIELSVGIATISQPQFEFQWEHDCLDEGYRP